MKWARVINGEALDVRTESPETYFTPNIVAEFVEVPDEVEETWLLTDGAWAEKPAPVVEEQTQEELDAITAENNNSAALIVRAERDAKLSATDWTQVADVPVDQAAWATYRQLLRVIPEQEGFPNNITWPTSP